MAMTDRRQAEPDTRPWAVYARLSKVASTGDLEKCEYQTELCKSYAASRGMPVGNLLEFADPSLSAWKKGVARPQWDEMMALAARGQLGGILVYAVDRFTRRPKDLEALIELADEHGPGHRRAEVRAARPHHGHRPPAGPVDGHAGGQRIPWSAPGGRAVSQVVTYETSADRADARPRGRGRRPC
jgi:hypothetical protein